MKNKFSLLAALAMLIAGTSLTQAQSYYISPVGDFPSLEGWAAAHGRPMTGFIDLVFDANMDSDASLEASIIPDFAAFTFLLDSSNNPLSISPWAGTVTPFAFVDFSAASGGENFAFAVTNDSTVSLSGFSSIFDGGTANTGVFMLGNGLNGAGTFSATGAGAMSPAISTAGGVIIDGGVNTFSGFTAASGAAIYLPGIGGASAGLTIHDGTVNVFQNNTATGPGGAIYMDASIAAAGGPGITIAGNNTFIGNSSGGYGGGAIYMEGTPGDYRNKGVVVTGTFSFQNNTTTGVGGAIGLRNK